MLTRAELKTRLHRFVVAQYHQRIHSETGMAPQTPWEMGGVLPRLPDSIEQLDLLLLKVAKARRVHQDGIHFQRLRYLDLTLAVYVGEWATIRGDPHGLAELRVFHGDRVRCRALCLELAGTTIGLKTLVRARDARRRELREGISERAKLVELLIGVHGNVPPELTSRAEPGPPAPRLKRHHLERCVTLSTAPGVPGDEGIPAFAEFCEACRRDRYIGVCSGASGVGKTLSPRHCARRDDIEAGLNEQRTTLGANIPPDLAGCHTLV